MYEVTLQSNFIKGKVARYQDSSPTAIYKAIDQIVKGTTIIIYQIVLIKDHIRELKKANHILSKYRRKKKI